MDPTAYPPIARLLSLYYFLAVIPNAEETKEALAHAIEDPDPFVSYYATHHATKGKLLAWRRLALARKAPAALRLLALHHLLEALPAAESASLLFQSCLGEPYASTETDNKDSHELQQALIVLVRLWHYPLHDDLLEQERVSLLQKEAHRLVYWMCHGLLPPPGGAADAESFFRRLWDILMRDDNLLRRAEMTYRKQRRTKPSGERAALHTPLLGQPLLEHLGLANDNQILSTLEALARIAHPAAEPTLLAMLDNRHAAITNEAILALGACGTSAAVKPLMQLQKKADHLQSSAIQRAISRIQTRTGAASVGGLSLTTEHDEGGEISIANHEDGALSLEPHTRPTRDD